MPKEVALWLCVGFVLFLFAVDTRRKGSPSLGAWLVLAYIAMLGSRAVSSWFNMGIMVETPDDYLEGSPLDRAVFIGFIVAGSLLILKRKVNWAWATEKNRWIIVFFLYACLSVAWSDYPFVAFKRWVKGSGVLVMAMVILTEEDPLESLRWVFRKSAFLLIPFSILFIKYFPEYGRGYSVWNGAQYYTGVTTNKNTLGTICFMYGIFFIWDLLAIRRGVFSGDRKAGLIDFLFLLMILYLFQKANSATSLICFIVGCSILVMMEMDSVKRNISRFGVYLIAFMLLFGALDVLFGIGEAVVTALGRDMTFTGRVDIWDEVISMSEDPVVGSGYETFWLGKRAQRMWDKFSWRPNQAHNGYIEIYLHLGVAGLVLLLFLMLSSYKNILLRLASDPTLGSLRMTFFLTCILYNFAEAAFKLGLLWFIFLLCCLDYEPGPVPALSRERMVWRDGRVGMLKQLGHPARG